MEDLIDRLESQVRKLLKQCNELQANNVKLQHSKVQIAREKEILMVKHKLAVTQIETMVSRLKSIEKSQ